MPDSAGVGSTLFSSIDLMVAALAAQRESSSAAEPDTWGVAIDVPLNDAYVPPGTVDNT